MSEVKLKSQGCGATTGETVFTQDPSTHFGYLTPGPGALVARGIPTHMHIATWTHKLTYNFKKTLKSGLLTNSKAIIIYDP